MGLFKKKKEVVDWTKNPPSARPRPVAKPYPSSGGYADLSSVSPQSSSSNSVSSSSESSGGFFGGFFGGSSSSPGSEGQSYLGSSHEGDSFSEDADEKRRKLALRLKSMTDKMEELSNQIYHLQQRVELLEKKLDVNRF